MKLFLTIITLCIVSHCLTNAQQDALPVPKVDRVVSPVLPRISGELDPILRVGVPMLVSTPNARAAELVWYGFNHLNAGWDVEAYRYFSEALHLDSSCLMAHSGVILALASPYHNEFVDQRKSAVLRIFELVEKKIADEYVFPEKERGFALSCIYLVTQGRLAGSLAFENLAKQYPNDLQIKVIHLLLMRDGINTLKKLNSGEQQARKKILELLEKFPDHPTVMQAYLSIYTGPLVSIEKLEEDILPVARKLSQLGNFSSWHHWHGITAYRCGILEEAEQAFKKSIGGLSAWKSKAGIADADADLLWSSSLYLVTVLYESGKIEEAQELALQLSKKEINQQRLYSKGTQLLLWEGRSVLYRLNLAKNRTDFITAAQSLPTEKQIGKLEGKTAALHYYDFLTVYTSLKQTAIKGASKRKQIDSLVLALEKQFIKLEELNKSVMNSPESTAYTRTMPYARALIADGLASSEDSLSIKAIEYSNATDNQILDNVILPPLGFYTFDEEWVKILIAQKKWNQAKNILDAAFLRRPSLKSIRELSEVVNSHISTP